MPTVVFSMDGDVAEQVVFYLGRFKSKAPAVIAQAANSTARDARKLILADIRERYTSKQKNKDLIPSKSIERANPIKTAATLHIKGRPQSIYNFNVQTSKGGTLAQVLSAGSLKPLEKGGIKAFVATMSNGHTGVFQRMSNKRTNGTTYKYTEHATRNSGKVYTHEDESHDRVKQLFSLGVPKMAGSALTVGLTLRDKIQVLLQQELAKQIDKTLSKAVSA